ncbi:hypothetical protein ASPCAL14079 [Aspergillus calidoustus]|uniref:FAD-binding domain-containing protein n=1 Tax=Aspergillus calidoustus TaxID=454130 RepID=A0A0U5CJ12_ASPCI|nr:hypothetical protein ASPCAL14079 [Aspergillus calidoustus]
MQSSAAKRDPVLIVGAGITGLILAHALKQKSIPFTIYERDPTPSSRHQGWALTLHWALQYLPSLLPPSVLSAIEAAQVDPVVAANDNGNFLFINNATGEVKWRIPPNRRWRVNRERLRRVLLRGVEEYIEWGTRVEGVKFADDEGGNGKEKPRLILQRRINSSDREEEEKMEEEQSEPATLIVGTEGSRSSIRRFLCPDNYTNNPLPIRFTGVGISLSAAEVAPLREMDPLLFQGCHPETGDYFWFSMLDAPSRHPSSAQPPTSNQEETNSAENGEERPYKVQLGLSWPVNSPTDEVPATDAERLANMKRRAANFVPFLRDVIQNIPEGTPVVEVKLADWKPQPWDNRGGTVTLVGDAAHAMTMYRGEACNHGILDVYNLVTAIEAIYSGSDPASAITDYETEMRERGERAVQLSHQACLDAHDWASLNENSAILARRKL